MTYDVAIESSEYVDTRVFFCFFFWHVEIQEPFCSGCTRTAGHSQHSQSGGLMRQFAGQIAGG